MTSASRPLRALGVVLGGWTAARVVALWPVNGAGIEAPLLDVARAEPARAVVAMPLDDDVPLFAKRPLSDRGMKALQQAHAAASVLHTPVAAIAPTIAAKAEPIRQVSTVDMSIEPNSAIAPGLPAVRAKNRFAGSAWALMRSNGAPSLASGGQLGGSQVGMRLFYAPGPDALAITARLSAPLSQPGGRAGGREAAFGVALRGKNVGLIAEQRLSLDKGGRDVPAVFAYGGVTDVRLGSGVKLDGYVQAGVVGVKDPAMFVDGAIRLERETMTSDRASLSVGAGAWAGAQPGVARLDVGPQLVARIAVAETSLRVSTEWRQRVAGDAAPASGPSVTVGFDF